MSEIEINNQKLSVSVAGNQGNTAVILLHGFPITNLTWAPFQKFLADNHLFSLAPNQRGYNPGSAVLPVDQYTLKLLVDDVVALADHFEIEKFHIVGHDWGSVVSWAVAAWHPGRVLSLSALSVPHPGALSQALAANAEQQKASTYMQFFQAPDIPEKHFLQNDSELLKTLYKKSTLADKKIYVETLSKPEVLTGAINWYRANYTALKEGSLLPELVSLPTFYAWGNKDTAICPSTAKLCKAFVTGYYKELELNSGHSIMEEVFDTISQELLTHMLKHKG